MHAKRVLSVVLLLVFFAAQGFAAEPKLSYKHLISADFGNIVAFIPLNYIKPRLIVFPTLSVVYEGRVNSLIGIRGELQVGIGIVLVGFGVNFYPFQRALEGWYIGVSGHAGETTTEVGMTEGGLNSGYQWILPEGLVFRLGVGYRAIYLKDATVVHSALNFEAAIGGWQ